MIARVLVVDDNEDVRAVLRDFLTDRHLQVVEATDGAQAFAVAEKEQPHLIITDVVMPGMYGTSASRRMRDYPATKDIPIIFISGSVEASLLVELLKQPGFRFLKKPIDLGVLERTMRELLPRGGFRPW